MAAERLIFAQLCKKLSPVETNPATIVELNREDGTPVPISSDEFIDSFYRHNGLFSLTDCCSNIMTLQSTSVVDSVWYVDGVDVNLEGLIVGAWENDLGVDNSCWTACSVMSITSELLRVNDLCNLKCNVCCSLKLSELFATLNAADDGTRSTDFVSGDRLTLSVLFTNDNPGVNPVEFRLNFVIA